MKEKKVETKINKNINLLPIQPSCQKVIGQEKEREGERGRGREEGGEREIMLIRVELKHKKTYFLLVQKS